MNKHAVIELLNRSNFMIHLKEITISLNALPVTKLRSTKSATDTHADKGGQY